MPGQGESPARGGDVDAGAAQRVAEGSADDRFADNNIRCEGPSGARSHECVMDDLVALVEERQVVCVRAQVGACLRGGMIRTFLGVRCELVRERMREKRSTVSMWWKISYMYKIGCTKKTHFSVGSFVE